MRIAVITPHLPERRDMLDELRACIEAQTRPPDVWIVVADYERAGPTHTANRALAAALEAGVDYILPFSDDNLMDPGHIDRLYREVNIPFGYNADIVYAPPKVVGRDGFEGYVNGPFDADRLMRESYIDASALCAAWIFRKIGGWRDGHGYLDHDWFKRAHAAGAWFVRVPEQTWTYRFHGGNDSWRG